MKKVALAGGLARALNKEGLSAAGKLGGNKVKEIHGITYYSQLGTKGGRLSRSFMAFLIIAQWERKGAMRPLKNMELSFLK